MILFMYKIMYLKKKKFYCLQNEYDPFPCYRANGEQFHSTQILLSFKLYMEELSIK